MTNARLQARAEAIIIAHEVQIGKVPSLTGLKPCRERSGLSLKDLAKTAGICAETYRSWETGKCWPSAYHLANIATVLGVSIEELYLGPEPEDGQT